MVALQGHLPEFLNQFRMLWNSLFQGKTGPDLALRVILLVLMILAGIGESLCKVYASIALGHQRGSHRQTGSFLAYILFSAAELILTSIPFVRELLHTGVEASANTLSGSLSISVPGILVSLAGIAISGFLTWWLLDRRLNLE